MSCRTALPARHRRPCLGTVTQGWWKPILCQCFAHFSVLPSGVLPGEGAWSRLWGSNRSLKQLLELPCAFLSTILFNFSLICITAAHCLVMWHQHAGPPQPQLCGSPHHVYSAHGRLLRELLMKAWWDYESWGTPSKALRSKWAMEVANDKWIWQIQRQSNMCPGATVHCCSNARSCPCLQWICPKWCSSQVFQAFQPMLQLLRKGSKESWADILLFLIYTYHLFFCKPYWCSCTCGFYGGDGLCVYIYAYMITCRTGF